MGIFPQYHLYGVAMKGNKILCYMLILAMLFSNFLLFNSVSADADELLCNFDDVSSGLSSFVSGGFSGERVSGTFETSTTGDFSSPNSLYLASSGSSSGGEGYLNLTSDYSYIGEINFSLYCGSGSAGAYVGYMSFYDYNDNEIIEIEIFTHSSSSGYIKWREVGSGQTTIEDVNMEGKTFHFNIKHNFTNQFEVLVLNDVGSTVYSDTLGGNYAGDYSNFSYIHFTPRYSGDYSTMKIYFDDFYINDDVPNTPPTANMFDLQFYDDNLGYSGDYLNYELGLEANKVYIDGRLYHNPTLFQNPLWIGAYGGMHELPLTIDNLGFNYGETYYFTLEDATLTYALSDGEVLTVSYGDVDFSINHDTYATKIVTLSNGTFVWNSNTSLFDEQQRFIHLRFIDAGTGREFNTVNQPIPPSYIYPDNNINLKLYLNDSFRITGDKDTPMYLSISSIAGGTYCYLNITNITGYYSGEVATIPRFYEDVSEYIRITNGSTYTIYLSQVSDIEQGYENYKYGFGSNSDCFIATDKQIYANGEEVRIRYRLTDGSQFGTDGHYLIAARPDQKNMWGEFKLDDYEIKVNVDDDFDGSYHEYSFTPDLTGLKGVVQYNLNVIHNYFWGMNDEIFSSDLIIKVLSGVTFEPYGNLTTISPSPAYLGDDVSIGYQANNSGYIAMRMLSDGDTEYIKLTGSDFPKPTTAEEINTFVYEVSRLGVYQFAIFIKDNDSTYSLEDTLTLNVNGVNGSSGSMGYGVEFLQVIPQICIAGHTNIEMMYGTLIENSTLIITDPLGQRLPQSTKINDSGTGVYRFNLPTYAEIGVYNVTLNAVDTLYSEFNVIAEENNYIEFTKNVFLEGEDFGIYLRHDKRVSFDIYKEIGGEYIPIGETYRFESTENQNDFISVPQSTVLTSTGNYKVEMWELNNWVRQKKLAEDTCMVISAAQAGIIVDGGNGFELPNLSSDLGAFVGVFVIFTFMLLPLFFMMAIKKGSVGFNEVPPVIYGSGAVIGTLLSTTLGFIDTYWLLIIIIVVVGLVALGYWNQRRM